jgi:hypothetical protein
VTEPQKGEEPSYELPPEGATCHDHPESMAVITCPRCGNYACLSCWHDPIGRCHACLLRDPLAASEPIAWEDPNRNPIARYLGTFASAFSPGKSAPAFARGGIGAALGFALLSFIPLALLGGIIPFTATLLFEPGLAWRTIGDPSDAEIAADIGRAAALGLFVSLSQAVVLGTAYASLVRAYLTKGHGPAPARAMLYRVWLLPMTRLLIDVGGWVAPTPELQLGLVTLGVVPLILLLSTMVSTARMGAGVGRFTSFIVVMVPVVVMMLSQIYLERALAPFLPDSEAISAAARAADGVVETPPPAP